MKYKAVLFDLDDTLTRSNLIYGKSLRYASAYLASMYNLDIDEFYKLAQEKHSLVSRNFPSVHTRHSRILVFRMALDEMVGRYDLSLLPEVEDMYWDYFMENMTLYDGVIETLTKIRTKGIRMAIVSDGSLSLRIRKVKASGLLEYFDEIIASEEVIFEKPFSAIFTLALTKLDVDADEALMIGNNYKNDIRGAQMVGIKAGVFDPEEDGNAEGQDGTIKPDFVLKEIKEVLQILGIE